MSGRVETTKPRFTKHYCSIGGQEMIEDKIISDAFSSEVDCPGFNRIILSKL